MSGGLNSSELTTWQVTAIGVAIGTGIFVSLGSLVLLVRCLSNRRKKRRYHKEMISRPTEVAIPEYQPSLWSISDNNRKKDKELEELQHYPLRQWTNPVEKYEIPMDVVHHPDWKWANLDDMIEEKGQASYFGPRQPLERRKTGNSIASLNNRIYEGSDAVSAYQQELQRRIESIMMYKPQPQEEQAARVSPTLSIPTINRPESLYSKCLLQSVTAPAETLSKSPKPLSPSQRRWTTNLGQNDSQNRHKQHWPRHSTVNAKYRVGHERQHRRRHSSSDVHRRRHDCSADPTPLVPPASPVYMVQGQEAIHVLPGQEFPSGYDPRKESVEPKVFELAA